MNLNLVKIYVELLDLGALGNYHAIDNTLALLVIQSRQRAMIVIKVKKLNW